MVQGPSSKVSSFTATAPPPQHTDPHTTASVLSGTTQGRLAAMRRELSQSSDEEASDDGGWGSTRPWAIPVAAMPAPTAVVTDDRVTATLSSAPKAMDRPTVT